MYAQEAQHVYVSDVSEPRRGPLTITSDKITHAWFGPTHWPSDTVAKASPSPAGGPWCPCYLILLHNQDDTHARSSLLRSTVLRRRQPSVHVLTTAPPLLPTGDPRSTAVCPCSPIEAHITGIS